MERLGEKKRILHMVPLIWSKPRVSSIYRFLRILDKGITSCLYPSHKAIFDVVTTLVITKRGVTKDFHSNSLL